MRGPRYAEHAHLIGIDFVPSYPPFPPTFHRVSLAGTLSPNVKPGDQVTLTVTAVQYITEEKL